MILNKKLSLILIFMLLVSCLFAQNKTVVSKTPMRNSVLPRNIKLLAGYVHQPGQFGMDVNAGTISKENGLAIKYEIGIYAANTGLRKGEKTEDYYWLKEQEFNGQKCSIIYRKNGSISARFEPHTNFRAEVKNNEHIADFLLMIATYGSREAKPNE